MVEKGGTVMEKRGPGGTTMKKGPQWRGTDHGGEGGTVMEKNRPWWRRGDHDGEEQAMVEKGGPGGTMMKGPRW